MKLPIAEMIEARCVALGVTPEDLGARLGAWGPEWVRGLCQRAFFVKYAQKHEHRLLAEALGVDERAVAEAMAVTFAELCPRVFVPYAVLATERRVPEPIFVAALLGVERLLKVELDASRGEDSFVAQALEGVKQKVGATSPPSIVCFGKVLGVVVNYAPDRAVRFDLDGTLVERLDRERRLGTARLSLSF